MKKLINEVDNIVNEMLDGMVAAYPQYVRRLEGLEVLVRAGGSEGKVALISGGGSGHEPAHGGYVGKGMLDGAVAGAVFTSPTPDQVYEAIKAANGGKGVLLVIKNYTGDVMNFEMAADMAADEGIEVEKVVVADDVAVENSTWTTGRRGIAGTVFVHKLAGACAEAGGSLQEVKRIAEKVIANVRSMGMAVDACTVPAVGKPSFDLAEDEIEIGIGIHGEPGVNREKISPVNGIVDKLLDKILAEGIYNAGDEVAVMVNGMGGTPLMELFVANKHVADVLAAKGIKIAKTLVGNYMTSLDMEGFSITLLKVDEELKALLNAPADTPAFVQA
ncbi:MAG: dihydroxyacetone kinase subunit DhaK [Clostridia bacterium]|nr:dihydroxyacetone kinase subunit DhaK [Clostridia bacterium]MBQ6358297.1 dihydroxyacetone kinase subunit DhaK [Clostridia bacterium]MBQ6866483.1 dihydroxyacetone kinase subunit DhaK [Clostridia bacterium]MBQ7755263.1 dihydroxyacetone kinase subunit DhaK [Clostridia bacterium]MBQ9322640.1 dihydroxyacetone kinase subunit DhaK [Clostridia bacterium]